MEMLDRQAVGERMKAQRKKMRLTQDQWAERLLVSKAQVSKYELGENLPGPDVLVRLWHFFGVDPLRLLTGEFDVTERVDKLGQQINLTGDESKLVFYYRACDLGDKELIERIAQSLASDAAARSTDNTSASSSSTVVQASGKAKVIGSIKTKGDVSL